MMRLISRLKAFRHADDGGLILINAFFITIACMMLGLIVDVGLAYYTKVKLTNVANSAAASAILSAPDAIKIVNTGVSSAASNTPSSYGVVTTSNDVTPGFYDNNQHLFIANSQPYNAVRVLAARSVDHNNALLNIFGNVLGTATFDVRATSYAVRYGGICLYVLSTSPTAFSTNGHPSLDMSTCSMQVNGSALTSSNTTITESYACVGGTVVSSAGWSTPPQQNCNTLPDPLANAIQDPPSGQCNYTNVPLNGTLNAGVYCYTNAGSVNVGHVTGTGVTLYFDANSYLSARGNTSIDITAPSTGPYAGIAIFQTRTPSLTANSFSFGGNSTFSVNGIIYLPGSNLSLFGTAGGAQNLSQVIVSTLSMSGTPNYTINKFGVNKVVHPKMIAHSSLFIPK